MKRTMRKDLFRAVTGSMGRFLSIFMIVALGCGFFAGIKATGPDMKEAADAYYDSTDLMDLHLISELGFSRENVDKIASTKGVSLVMPSYQTILPTINQGETQNIRVQSISAGEDWAQLNKLAVVSGRLPQNTSECVIDQRAVIKKDYSLGQSFTLEDSTAADAKNTAPSILSEHTLTIVGTVDSSQLISLSWAASSLGSKEPDYNVFVLPDAFSSDIYTDVYVTAAGSKELASYSDAYTSRVDEVLADLKATGSEQGTIRKNEVIEAKKSEFLKTSPTQEQLTAAQAALGEVSNNWYYIDRTKNSGYTEFRDDAARIDAIASVFPFFFFAVAALVSLTTMTRMVDEERTQIGSLKALGYSRRSIAVKYVSYAAMASVLGGLAGLLIGFQLFPRVIYKAYLIMNRLPPIHPPFRMELAWITLLTAVIGTSLAALLAILTSLHATPATLMRPKAPKIGKRVFLEKIHFIWKRMGFIEKITARNLFRYKKRFFMTVIGIAGCTALILTGFGLKDSISGIVEKQYGEIMKYDLQIVFENTVADPKTDKTFSWLSESREIKSITPVSAQTAKVVSSKKADTLQATLIVPSNIEDFFSYADLRTRVGKEALSFSDEGVILTEKLAYLKNVGVGDTITLQGIDDKNISVTVSGICENYLYHYIYMTPTLYEKLYGGQAPLTAAFAKLSDTSTGAINDFKDTLMNQSNIAGSIFIPIVKAEFGNIFTSLNYVMLVLILSAFALAMVVLYNLTNININERIREIATIKVLGFYDMEVSTYVFRENAIITILGAGFGLVLGTLLHSFVVQTAEIDMIMFGRDIAPVSFLISFALTLLFSLVVNIVMHFYLKKISMVESLKSTE
ncbi:MAG: ABC transporter permease [Eubacteriales bacterium]